jgi:hypothetical protein
MGTLPRGWLLALWLLAVGVGVVQTARLGLFILDATKADASILPGRPFFRTHSCLSAYTEACRLVSTGVNIYDPTAYGDAPATPPRFLGPLKVDAYLYPPPFLLLPALPKAAGIDFMATRRVWFVAQVAVFLWAALAAARWVGGRAGQIATWLVPALCISVPTLLGLQIGNFQITAFSLSLLAMLAFERQRAAAAGGLALGFVTASKIFPGVLGLLLVAERRWRAVAWTAVGGVALALLTLVVFGAAPFRDFFLYQLPRIQSGEAFFWIDDPDVPPINHSVYGLVTKLRALGLSPLTREVGSRVSSAYAVLMIAVVALASWRIRALRAGTSGMATRVRLVQTWLALLSLASFRSPFVPDAYAYVGTLWLLTWFVAERRWPWPALSGWIVLFVACAIVVDGTLTVPVPRAIVAATLALQLAVFALNLYAIARRVSSDADVPAEAGVQLA